MAVAGLVPEGNLYLETFGSGQKVIGNVPENEARRVLAEIGKETGVMPVDNGLGVNPMEVENEPVYVGPAEYLRRYARPVLDEIKRYFARHEKAVPYFGNLKIRVEKLPTYWGLFIEKTSQGLKIIPRIVGKVFGYYNPETDELGIDPITFDGGDREAKYMAIKPEKPWKVLGHEIIHAIQRYTGTLLNYPRQDVEAEAEKMASGILGVEPRAYPVERQGYERTYGENWLTDLGSYARRVKEKYLDPVIQSFCPQPAYATA